MMEKNISRQITVYRPNQRHELGFFETWSVMAKNIINSES